jgi:arylsulfatase A-like enzyme
MHIFLVPWIALLGCATLTVNAENRPNVLVIAIDDLRDELGCYGAAHIRSSNIDAVAARGVRFDRAYCQYAVCGPSRASVFSGLRPDSTGVTSNKFHFRDRNPDIVALPQLFKKHGYYTRGLGKILHNNMDDPPSWSEPYFFGEPRVYASDQYAGQVPGIDGIHEKNLQLPVLESADVDDDAYIDGTIADQAIKTIRKAGELDQPFMLMIGFHKPHSPFNAPKKYWDLYSRETIQLAPNPFPPTDAPPFALNDWRYLRGFKDMPKEGLMPDDLARQVKHAYYACISYIDAQVGKLLSELKSIGATDNTIVVIWSDHGYQLGEHGMWCKHTNFETSTKVPLIIADPRSEAAGGAIDARVELVDLFPTLADLCGLPKPDHLEGESFATLVSDPDAWNGQDTAAFSQFHRGGNRGLSIRTGRFRYTEWRAMKSGKLSARELYDHENDPLENTNVAEQVNYRDSVTTLSKRLQNQFK